jgi:uncharacterized membrane protein
MRLVARGLAVLSVVWVLALVAAPVALLAERRTLILPAMVVYAVGGRVCHQIYARSFHIDVYQLPVCARCTGLYASAACGAVAGLWAGSRIAAGRARAVLLLAATPTAVTWGAEMAGLAHPSNVVRAVAALPLGFAAAWLVIASAKMANAECRMPNEP